MQQGAAVTGRLDGRYRLEECVGSGSVARVHRAIDEQLGRTVAVKLMRDGSDDLCTPERAQNEMTVLASLSHPSLVKLYDGRVRSDGPSYLVMEYVDGETLAAALGRGPLPAARVRHLATELSSALHVVHRAGVVHRDLKPSNILLAENPVPGLGEQVKLGDFGVAQLVDGTRITAAGTIVGTAAYLAPEQVRGEPAGPASDVYALGLVLLEALTGVRAYGQSSGIAAVMARLIDPPPVPGWVGPEWARLLTEMTATDAAHRPAALDVAQRAATLPIDIAPDAVGDPEATQPAMPVLSALPSIPPAPTLPSVPVAPALPSIPVASAATEVAVGAFAPTAPSLRARPARRRRARALAARRRRIVAAGGGAVAAATVALGLVLGAGVPGAPATSYGELRDATSSPVPEPLLDGGADEATPSAPEGQVEDGLSIEPASHVVEAPKREAGAAADKAAKDLAKEERKAAKDAEKTAEKAARDLAKEERKAAKEAEKAVGANSQPGKEKGQGKRD
ncbi:serine/threonine-protein kinase [Microbacterium gallinarum]|uniref:non-specific serine/threonine protein kinase n=1 Tax=Microbacterium gallinarum TaxID=2762209 RepID=A0ABR8X0R8_9MICO|nr:serine/threonine-protein kinase [Microbacterium gallinarum]MBD8022431.1 protein kinase [Microbacterium gallinarum]